jgi:transketolase
VVRSSPADKVTIVGAGITLFEALGAYDTLQKQGIAARVIDLYSLQPIDTETLQQAARETGVIVTVEDHYPAGGIGEAVMNAVAPIGGKVHQIAVRELPRSGRPEELVDKFGLSASHIVDAVKSLL